MSRQLANAVQHFNEMVRTLHPEVFIDRSKYGKNKPKLLESMLFEFMDFGQVYDCNMLGSFVLRHDKKVVFSNFYRTVVSMAEWDSPDQFDKHFVKYLNKAARKYDHVIDLGTAYRLCGLPDYTWQLLCHPDCGDDVSAHWTAKTPFIGENIKKTLSILHSTAIPKTYHFLMPRAEFFGIADSSRDYKEIGWFFDPAFVIRVNHVRDTLPFGDSLTSDFDQVVNNLCKYGNRYVKQTSDTNRSSNRRRPGRTV